MITKDPAPNAYAIFRDHEGVGQCARVTFARVTFARATSRGSRRRVHTSRGASQPTKSIMQ
jgi:hypothetical protein